MELLSLETRNFRNLTPGPLNWQSGSNLVFGNNGEGKTNLLEAVAVLGSMRSFRTSRLQRVIRHGEDACLLSADVRKGGRRLRLEQTIEIGPPLKRTVRLNGRPITTERYLGVFPVFALTGRDHELVSGPPRFRRQLLDRFAFLLEPRAFAEIRDFRRALRQRNAALGRAASDGELEAWEQTLAAAAARLVLTRLTATRELRAGFQKVYDQLRAKRFPEITIGYGRRAWSEGLPASEMLEETYRKRYNATRARDRQSGYTLEGPHRHDLLLQAGDRSVRDVLSSGQTKIVAAALRLAAVVEVEGKRGEHLPIIVDDVDAELDRRVLARLAGFLAGDRQIFLASAHGDVLAATFQGATRFKMTEGSCRRFEVSE